MLTIAMGRLLAMDMDMLKLPMADMLLSDKDMTLLNMDMNRPDQNVLWWIRFSRLVDMPLST